MDQCTDPQTAAEQRSLAVAKLKRAASLPRMKNGRRPAMHVDGVSEGENPLSAESTDKEATPSPELKVEENGTDVAVPTETIDNTIEDDTVTAAAPEQTAKRRSRSRNRRNSRGRDLRSPTPRSPTPNDSAFTEEELAIPPTIQMPTIPPLISPIPSHIGSNPLAHLLMQVPPMSPDPSQYYSNTKPSTPMMSPTPMLPTLQALQQGLFRSNSAGNVQGRMLAMHKLTRGTEAYVPTPSASPMPNQLNRNNTVSGGERSAARMMLLNRLGARTGAGMSSDSDQVNTDDTEKPGKRRRRRHSRHRSKDGASLDTLRASPGPPVSATPVPPSQEMIEQLRSMSTTPGLSGVSPLAHAIRHDSPTMYSGEFEKPGHPRRRSVVVEEDDDSPMAALIRRGTEEVPKLPSSPRLFDRAPSRGPALESSQRSSPAAPVLVEAYSQRYEALSSSPFLFPLREKTLEQEEEEVSGSKDDSTPPRSPIHDDSERAISWVATPVFELGVYHESASDDSEGENDIPQEDEDDHTQSSVLQVNGDSPPPQSDTLAESEEPPPELPATPPPSSPILSQGDTSEFHSHQNVFPARLSVASRINSEQTNETTDSEMSPAASKTRSGEPSAWEKVKNTFSRSNSSTGRRSRSNSLVNRRDQTESSVSRESGGSLISAKTDKTDGLFVPQQSTIHSPNTSVSVMSVGPMGPRNGHSPAPTTSVDLSRYTSAKLFPFPGIVQFAEQNHRARGLLSVSTPDISLSDGEDAPPPSPYDTLTTVSSELGRDRKLSHQASDSRLITKYVSDSNQSPVSPSSKVGSSIRRPATPTKLPMTLPAVKRWMSDHKFFKSANSPPTTPLPSTPTDKKADLLRPRKDNDSDWDEGKSDKSKGTAKANGTTSDRSDVEKTPKAKGKRPILGSPANSDQHEISRFQFPPRSPPPLTHSSSSISAHLPHGSPKPPSPASPNPLASLDSLQPKSTSSSGQSTSSQEIASRVFISQSHAVMERLDDHLSQRGRITDVEGNEEQLRKLVLFSPVLQVVNSDIVKDRFLLLFSDVLVICKPVLGDAEGQKLSLEERKFIVKNVVQLKHLRFMGDRAEKTGSTGAERNPLMASFVSKFGVNPDAAITSMFEGARMRNDPVALGKLLFRTSELDRSRLGEYLSRRSSKQTLKTFIDEFGLQGLRVDTALRVFLLSLSIPMRTSTDQSLLEHMLDIFAGRWYAANAAFIPYDRDLAVRLVRATVQLNDFFHESFSTRPKDRQHQRRSLQPNDFISAFRRFDLRNLVSDEVLQGIYESVRRESLAQSNHPTSLESKIVIKRSIPTSVTYKVQSEPIVLRLPQADPKLRIELYGQDLVFDPPVLHFNKSAEASFKVTGTSLGGKTMIFCRAGPNAAIYSGLPLSSSIMVERAFMRSTFQVAFVDHHDNKRRYMFSVKDPVLRHKWVDDFKRQVEEASSVAKDTNVGTVSQAAEKVAFKVLQETLIGPSGDTNSKNLAINGARLNVVHARSKSRSQLYDRAANGRNELEITGLDDDFFRNSLGPETFLSQKVEGRIWTGRDIQVQCQQNGSIARLLAYLRVWTPNHDQRE